MDRAPVSGGRPGPSANARPALWRRLVPLAVTGVGLYVVWPALRQTWAAAPTLQDAHTGWFLAMGLLQAASFACLWRLQQLALDTSRLLLVATSQLTSNAVGKVVPAGGAAAAALQHRMLVRGGIDPIRSATGVTVVAIVTNASVFLMPVASLPTLLRPTGVAARLAQAAWTGLAIAAGLTVVAIVLVRSDRVLRAGGRALQWLSVRVRRRDAADLPDRLVQERDLFVAFLGPRWLPSVLWTIGRIGLDYLSLLAALAAVGAEARAGLVVLAYVAAMVLATIPITPGGLGFVEAGLTATLTVAGTPAALAATATLGYRLATYWVPIAAGGPAYLLFRHRYGRLATVME